MDIVGSYQNLQDRCKWVAIIGTRTPSLSEADAAKAFVKRLVETGYIIVSGLAKGIDSVAHETAIAQGGTTVAICSTAKIESIYPYENKELALQIRQHGCTIHPYKTPAVDRSGKFTQFQKRLVERDLLLACLCPTIVAISDEPQISGGTAWAIYHCKKIGHDVSRYSSIGGLHSYPPTDAKKETWWDLEIDLHGIIEELNRA
jgi:DNA processing protein